MTWRVRNGTALLAGLMLVVLVATPVLAASTTWKVYSFNSSGRALRAQAATVTSAGAVSFTFPATADAAYLLTAKVGGFGAMTGQTLSGTASIVATGGTTFVAYPDGCNPLGADPKVGLYFETKSTGGFDPSSYWWSSERVLLTSLGTATVLSRALTQGNWTDYDGQADPAAFAAAASNVVAWGVSFGGGCHYANGVGTPSGSAVFTFTPTLTP